MHTGPKAVFSAMLLASVCGVPIGAAQAQTQEHVLYRFSGTDGSFSERGVLARDAAGNFYGATCKLAPDRAESVLYSFAGGSGCGTIFKANK